MKKDLFNKYQCPECTGELNVRVTEQEGEEIIKGVITCKDCGRIYDINEGIARMLPDKFRGEENNKT